MTPKSSLNLYAGTPIEWKNTPDILEAHKLIKASKLPNYVGCHITVKLGLNIKNWRHYLPNYWDQQLCHLLEYGFPLDFDRKCSLNSVEEKHTSANKNMSHISKFYMELTFEAVSGPFDDKPIYMHISPLLVRD